MSNSNTSAPPTAGGSSPNPSRERPGTYQGSPHPVSPFPETQIGPQGPSNKHGKKRRHRGHKKRRPRRPSFAPATVETPHADSPDRAVDRIPEEGESNAPKSPEAARRASFYRLGQIGGINSSETSLDSEALLDHRNQPMLRPRHDSRLAQSFRPDYPPQSSFASAENRPRPTTTLRTAIKSSEESEGESDEADDRTPLIRPNSLHNTNFVRYGADNRDNPRYSRRSSGRSIRSEPHSIGEEYEFRKNYDVNNPPSVPGSPKVGPEFGYDDSLITGRDFGRSKSPETRSTSAVPRDVIIDMDGAGKSLSVVELLLFPSKTTYAFPTGALSDLGEEEFTAHPPIEGYSAEPRRRRRRVWPDLSVLEEWSREEKEERTEGIRTKKISEPVLVGGRLRIRNTPWRREEDEAPYRFTYFNEEFQSTIHSQTISELAQSGQTFKDLFIPDPPELESDEEEEEDEFPLFALNGTRTNSSSMPGYNSRSDQDSAVAGSREVSPNHRPQSPSGKKEKRYGPRPTFWLDVLSPTDAEMRTIAKAFGIHALTAEDIMMQEAREKVELFRHYYFINYRTFEQDINSEDFLEPVNMYVIVFREGLLSFHFSQTPHPANVRRRIRQLKDYLILNSDWISYAIIDDITDVFGPLIHSIEDEVDDIDDTILRMHSDSKEFSDTSPSDAAISGSDMLRRVGECRKKVMGLYRLLGNKADVIKGFAKRCNEQWQVAPKSEIGLYLGDIQDHILTMTGNLTHYETLLSRAHSNYLAQINIRMNERQEQTADVLGKLTVLGTIVLPMNIICGMWGMNVKVPGQDIDNLNWFMSISAGLVVFAVVCFYVAKRVYRIV
ncbi:conserved hypothetical protein [Uncinocarpus reesii 1704]|uniref:Uncharacterized protein n=1 Tax=Uncinocarpus reesii (strain UAMH 1704) TaxID=336963 RepID=C4JEL2_UNCRE|nr:uncharacterized protein UREG_00851 [Uncinocarpus reesii 1704]EEP76004.1 conserved hypothetical protein [Uncinocarpus reesii 1704]